MTLVPWRPGRDQLRTLIAIAITVLWAVAYLAAVFTQNYAGVIPMTPVVLLAAAYLFGVGRNGGSGD